MALVARPFLPEKEKKKCYFSKKEQSRIYLRHVHY